MTGHLRLVAELPPESNLIVTGGILDLQKQARCKRPTHDTAAQREAQSTEDKE